MGITMINFGGLFAPLQALMGWLAPARPQPSRSDLRACAARPSGRRHALAHAATRAPSPALVVRRAPPLRVVRVVEGPAQRAGAGRMFMSGRMADVCAELDRLAALEAAAG